MDKLLLTFKDPGENQAGPKATSDVEKILKKNGFKTVSFFLNLNSKIQKMYYAKWYFAKLFKEYDIQELVIQYPIYSRYIVRSIIKQFRKKSRGHIYFIVHDLEGLRLYKDDETYSRDEISFINDVDGAIVHNPAMKAYLQSNGVKSKLSCINFFDYLVDDQKSEDLRVENSKKTMCFAGNLGKAPFIKKLSLHSWKLHVYGINPDEPYSNGIEYKGVFPPDDLPLKLLESYGLVWDGDSIEECNGIYGDYIRYNTPHKASLYLSAGIPLIVWEQSAISELVKKFNLGISVESLNDIETVINGISESDYSKMKKNTIIWSSRVRNGCNVLNALKELEENR